MNRRTKRRIAVSLLFLALGIVSLIMFFTSIWDAYVDYFLHKIVVPLSIFSLPSWAAVPVAMLVVVSPLLVLGTVLGFLARPFIRLNETEVSGEYLADITASLSKLKAASVYFQDLSLSIEVHAASVERLKTDIESLQELKGEDVKKLQSKFHLIRGISMPMRVLSHLVVFVAGVAMSVVGSYATAFIKAAGKWPY